MSDDLFDDKNGEDHTKNELFTDDMFVDPDKDWVEELVGDGKKFKDIQALARGKAEADAHAKRVEAEKERVLQELRQAKTVEDLVAELRNTNTIENTENLSNQPNPAGEQTQNQNQPTFSQEELEQLVKNKLSEAESVKSQEGNMKTVQSKLEEHFGPNWKTELNNQCTKLGLTQDYMKTLAQTEPKAFLHLATTGTEKYKGPPVSQNFTNIGQENTGAPTSIPAGTTYSFYEKMRVENPTEYYTGRVQNEMFEKAKALGNDFYK